jgi:DNA-binding MarR family transcriptional regulator
MRFLSPQSGAPDDFMPRDPVPPENSQRRLPPLLRRAWYSLNQTFRHRIAHLEITPDQYSILRWLHEGDVCGLTQQTITDLMASDPNTITSILKRMEKAGLVSRHEHESDRRARRVRLEPGGRRAFSAALEIARRLQDEILAVLPKTSRARFLADLETIAQACSDATSRKKPA